MSERTDHETAEVPALVRYVPPFPDQTAYHWIRRFRGCSSFPRGSCWSASHPYYSGHYQTKLGALMAARKMRKQLAAKWGARS